MEDFLDTNIGDVEFHEFFNQAAMDNKSGQPDGGDHKKNSITIIHHQRPAAELKNRMRLNLEKIPRPMKEEFAQRRSSELITAVQSYANHLDEEDEDPSVFDLSEAAMTAELMDMFEKEILYSCTELDTLLSEGEELSVNRNSSTSLGHS